MKNIFKKENEKPEEKKVENIKKMQECEELSDDLMENVAGGYVVPAGQLFKKKS